MIRKKGGIGIALDDCAAIEILGDRFRILRSKKDAMAFRVYVKRGDIVNETLKVTDAFQPLKFLEAI